MFAQSVRLCCFQCSQIWSASLKWSFAHIVPLARYFSASFLTWVSPIFCVPTAVFDANVFLLGSSLAATCIQAWYLLWWLLWWLWCCGGRGGCGGCCSGCGVVLECGLVVVWPWGLWAIVLLNYVLNKVCIPEIWVVIFHKWSSNWIV